MVSKVLIDERKLINILTPLSSFCKNRIRFYDDRSKRYLGERGNLPFCIMMEKSTESNYICTQCNEVANERCRNAKNGFHYFCHANLIEIICPVRYGGVYVGNIGLGQFRSRQQTIDEAYLIQLEELTGVGQAKIRKVYNSHPLIKDKSIEGAKMLLELCAKKLCEAGVFSIDHRDIINKAELYIKANLAGELTLEKIAAHVFVNPSYLSALYSNSSGITLFRYIRQERISRAVYLMCNTTMSIAKLSAAVGFKDPNYFSKVFKKETGLSPREYKRKLSTGEITP